MNRDGSGHNRFFRIVFQQDAGEGVRPIHDQIVGARGFGEGEMVGGQVGDVDFTVQQELLKGFHIPLFRPPDVFHWIVESFFLIIKIVTARSVGAGHLQSQLLAVIFRTVESGRHCADHYDCRFPPRRFPGKINWIQAGSTRADNNGIDTVSTGEMGDAFLHPDCVPRQSKDPENDRLYSLLRPTHRRRLPGSRKPGTAGPSTDRSVPAR